MKSRRREDVCRTPHVHLHLHPSDLILYGHAFQEIQTNQVESQKNRPFFKF